MNTFRGTLNSTMRNSMIVAVPVTVWMTLAAGPVLGFIFEGGVFSVQHTAGAAPLLRIMMLAVPFWLLQQVGGRAFYALGDTLTPALVGTAATLLAVPCYYVFVPRLGASGVAMVTTVSLMVYAWILLLVARRRWAKDAFAGVAVTALRSLLLSVPGGVLAILVIWGSDYLSMPVHPLLHQFLVLSVSGLLFSAAWLMAARLFLPDYFQVVLSPFLNRLRRKTSATEESS